MVINFLNYVETKKSERKNNQAQRDAEGTQRVRLELFLKDLIAEFQAA